MIKIHTLTTCKHCGGEAYIPVGKVEGCTGETYTRYVPFLIKCSGLPVIHFHDCWHAAASIKLSLEIPPVIVAVMLCHSISFLLIE